MTDQTNWQASFIEQRSAWGISLCAILLIMIASAQPQWLDFSSPATPSHQGLAGKTNISSPAKIKAPQPSLHTRQTITPKTLTPKITRPKTSTHKTTPIKPIQRSTKTITSHRSHAMPANAIAAGFYVQLGAFDERPRAQGLADQLKKKGWSVKFVHKKDGLYGVWIGPKANRTQVEHLLHSIQKTLKFKGFIIHHKP